MNLIQKYKSTIDSNRDSSQLHWKVLYFCKVCLGSLYHWVEGKVVHWLGKMGDKSLVHLFPEQKLLFVEVPKAGCTSVKYALRAY